MSELKHARQHCCIPQPWSYSHHWAAPIVHARFYFLSNDELLEILAEAKDPLAVQPFVKKCFEAVKELVFEDGHIVGLISGEGEKITFNAHVDPVALGELPVDELLICSCLVAAVAIN